MDACSKTQTEFIYSEIGLTPLNNYYYLFIQLYDDTARYNKPQGAEKHPLLGEKLQYFGLYFMNLVKILSIFHLFEHH